MAIDRPYITPMNRTIVQVMSSDDNPRSQKRFIFGQATSGANGIAQFYFTHDGTSNGRALLTSIDCAFVSVYSTNDNLNLRPMVDMRERNLAGKYVAAHVSNFSGVTILGINVLGSRQGVSGALVDFIVLGSYDLM